MPSLLSVVPRQALAGLCALVLCASVQAQVRAFDIAGGDLKGALDAYAAQSGTQLIYKLEDVKGRSTKGLRRELSPDEALHVLLEGTSLAIRRDVSGAVVLYVEPAPKPDKHVDDATSPTEVIVTASRRNEPVREVPMQVSILSTDNLNREGAKTLRDYLSDQAGVDLKSFGGPGGGSISVRGVSTGAQTIATVGVYVDEVAVGSSTSNASGPQLALDMALLDLNHIELLRGPQGTLYGAGAMGGLLKYVTNEPDTSEFSGNVAVTASSTRGGGPNHTASGVVNVPLKEDVAALRVSAFKDHAGGEVDAIGPAAGSNVDRGDTTGVRASLLLTPVRHFTARLTATTQKIESGGNDFVDYSPVTHQPVEGDRERELTVREPRHVKTDLYSADLEYDFGAARLNSITSVQRLNSSNIVDLSSAYVPLLPSLNLGSAAVGNQVAQRKTTQEFRLTSKSDKQFEWLAGLYYDHEQAHVDQSAFTTLASGVAGPDLADADVPSDYKEYAGYGDVTWKFDNGIALTGGLRIAHNKQRYVQNSSGLLLGGVTSSIDAGSDDTSKTWLVTARYALTPLSSVYARVATGYRPGGPNAVSRSITTGELLAPTSFGPDSLTSYEAGYKADLFDKKLSLETAIYDIEWKDIQQFRSVNGVSVIVNGGGARVQGAEASLTFRPTQAWTFTGNASVIDAKLTDDAPGLDANAGARLPGSAKFAITVGTNYEFDLAGHAAYVGATDRYVGERNAGYDGSASAPNYRLPGYSLTDLQAGIDFKRANVAFFVRNLFNAHAQLGATGTVQPLGGPAWVSLAQARTVGMTVTLPF